MRHLITRFADLKAINCRDGLFSSVSTAWRSLFRWQYFSSLPYLLYRKITVLVGNLSRIDNPMLIKSVSNDITREVDSNGLFAMKKNARVSVSS